MGLLEKRNARATRKTVIRNVILGAAGGLLFSLVMLFRSDFGPWGWVFMLSFMIASGALTGAAIEWQLSDDLEDENAVPKPAPDSGESAP
jgi:hypothetical protein